MADAQVLVQFVGKPKDSATNWAVKASGVISPVIDPPVLGGINDPDKRWHGDRSIDGFQQDA